jgi:hypothetical protein
MSQHTYHPDSHEYGLADECPRCEEHGRHPIESLDGANLNALVERVRNDEESRSENEAAAMRVIENLLRQVERLRSVGVTV